MILNYCCRERMASARRFDMHVTIYSDRYSARDQMNSPMPAQAETRTSAPSHDASIAAVAFDTSGTHMYAIGTNDGDE